MSLWTESCALESIDIIQLIKNHFTNFLILSSMEIRFVKWIKIHAVYYGGVYMTAIRFPVDYEFDWSIYPSVTGVTNEGEHRIAVQERSGI